MKFKDWWDDFSLPDEQGTVRIYARAGWDACKQALEMTPHRGDQVCIWIFRGTFWETACGEVCMNQAGLPSEDGFRYCPYCARFYCEHVTDEQEVFKNENQKGEK